MGNLNKAFTARLQNLRNRAARIITLKGYDERSLVIRKQLSWDDLETSRRKHTAILMYKIVNKEAPSYLNNLFKYCNDKYEMREKGSRLILPKFNTEFSKNKSFSFIGAKIWNSIPYSIRSAPTLSAFNKKIKDLAVI